VAHCVVTFWNDTRKFCLVAHCHHVLKWYQKVLSGGSLRLHVSKSRCVHKISM
jgi:hypothetical protein